MCQYSWCLRIQVLIDLDYLPPGSYHKPILYSNIKSGVNLSWCQHFNMSARKIGEFSQSHLLKVAEDVIQKKTSDSVLLDTRAEAAVPKFKLKGMLPY